MSERIKMLIQKRAALKRSLTALEKLIGETHIDQTNIELRVEKLTSMYDEFGHLNDELSVLDLNGDHNEEFQIIEDRYFAAVSKVKDLLHPRSVVSDGASASTESVSNASASSQKRTLKLPQATLPTFDGKYENWFSFRNAFLAIVDSHTELSNIEKLHYLKTSLKGEALNKINMFEMTESNYQKAWQLLVRSYEVRRILISRHLSLLLGLPVQDRESREGLTKLADDAQQHVASLASLGVNLNSEILVHILANKLHKNSAEKWEESLTRDEYPTIESMYEFLYKTAVCISMRKRSEAPTRDMGTREQFPSKRTRYIPNQRTFMTNSTDSCGICRGRRHPLFKCIKFRDIPVHKRFDAVRSVGFCVRCLQGHERRNCDYKCKLCKGNHNVLLHLNRETHTNKERSDINTAPQDNAKGNSENSQSK